MLLIKKKNHNKKQCDPTMVYFLPERHLKPEGIFNSSVSQHCIPKTHQDGGKSSKLGAKLPEVCRNNNQHLGCENSIWSMYDNGYQYIHYNKP